MGTRVASSALEKRIRKGSQQSPGCSTQRVLVAVPSLPLSQAEADESSPDLDATSLSGSLRSALSGDRTEAWLKFVRLASKPIRGAILRTLGTTLGPKVLEDLSQETFSRLCEDRCAKLRQIAEQPDHHVAAYLRTAAASVALDHIRMIQAKKRGAGEPIAVFEEGIVANSSTHFGGEGWIQRKILLDQISSLVEQTCFGLHGQRDQKVFELYFGSGLTAGAIAQLPNVGLSVKGVESTILRLVRSLREALKAKKP